MSLKQFKKMMVAFSTTLILGACGVEETPTNSSKEPTTSQASTPFESTLESSAASVAESEESVNKDQLGDLTVHFIDAGQADATLFEFADDSEEYTILYDTGDWNSTDVVDYLDQVGISELDLVIVSHPDADHIGQLDKVLQQVAVDEVWMSGNTTTSDVFKRSLKAIQEQGTGYYEPRAGEEFDVGPLDMTILHPAALTGDTNADSISMLISYGEIDFVFTGDANKKEELKMLDTGIDIDAEILSLGHHGSNTSSDPAFVNAVSPEIAIYSAGASNSYGHPSPEVVSLMEQEEIPLYGTDVHGTIVVTTNGEQYDVQTVAEGTVSSQEAESTTPEKNETAASSAPVKQEASTQGIDLNAASLEELQQIIHIGPERAEEIISLRPFQSVEGLERVSGIGPARLEDILQEGKAYVGGR